MCIDRALADHSKHGDGCDGPIPSERRLRKILLALRMTIMCATRSVCFFASRIVVGPKFSFKNAAKNAKAASARRPLEAVRAQSA